MFLSHTEILDMHARLTPQQRAEIDDHLRNQKKIMAIRATREALGTGLKDAKEFIDWYQSEEVYLKTPEEVTASLSHEGKLESALFRVEVLSRDMVSTPEKFDTVAVAELLADICEEAKGGLSSPRTVQGVGPEIEEAIARLEAFMVLAQPQLKGLPDIITDVTDDLLTAMTRTSDVLKRLVDVEGILEEQGKRIDTLEGSMEDAGTAAGEAKEAADDALKAAEEAGTVAKAAEETADEALELAQNVEKVADDAEDIASGAKALAEEAESEAEAAREEASDAKEIAEDVQRALGELDSRVDELE
jgi:methyl-accepting chemotaxis protein